ncbi:MAG: PAS domain S-box protein [Magnetovibrio sp.]|nr:PAS domain S-box protein [Magnetovibrio sp.]
MMHRLLFRQLKKVTGLRDLETLSRAVEDLEAGKTQTDADLFLRPEIIAHLFNRISASYEQFERDLALRGRSLQLSSKELSEANTKISKEAERQSRGIRSLRETANTLLESEGKQKLGPKYSDMERLSSIMSELVADRATAKRELEFQKFALDQHAIVSITDADGKIQYANDLLCKLSGYDRNELLGQKHSLVNSGTHPDSFFDNLWTTITSGKVWHGKICNRNKNGNLYWVSMTILPLLPEQNMPLRYISISTDITELEQAKNAVRKNEERYRQIADASSDWVWEMDSDLKFSYFSSGFQRLTGIDPAFSLGKTRVEISAKNELNTPKWQHHLQDLEARNPFRDFRFLFEGPDNKSMYLSISGVPIFDKNNVFQGYRGTSTDVSQMVMAENKLKVAKEEAEKANEAKSSFLSSMSHELRTPLNAILGFGQLLEADNANPLLDYQQDALSHIMSGGRHLLELVNQVLDLAKIESGNLSLSIENVKPDEIVESCILMAKAMGEKNKINISLEHLQPQMPFIRADATRFRQVLLNLLSNAVKYNEKNGSIILETEQIGDLYLRFTVTDSGEGISDEHVDKLFLPFHRLSHYSGQIEGTGIGLAITKELVQSMGGGLGFETQEGVGSVFWFELPIAPDDLAPKSTEKKRLDFDKHSNAHPPQKRKVLYIEDNRENVTLMKAIFRNLPHLELISSPTAEKGIEKARQEKPHLILADINLPGMNGIEAFHKLRTLPETFSIPVIAISAAAMPHDIENGEDAGFSNYLTKPIDINTTLDAITEILGSE